MSCGARADVAFLAASWQVNSKPVVGCHYFLPFGQYQITLLGSRGTCAKTCPLLESDTASLGEARR